VDALAPGAEEQAAGAAEAVLSDESCVQEMLQGGAPQVSCGRGGGWRGSRSRWTGPPRTSLGSTITLTCTLTLTRHAVPNLPCNARHPAGLPLALFPALVLPAAPVRAESCP